MLAPRRELLYWRLPAWICGITILILTSIPSLKVPPLGFKLEDKVYHFLAYAALGLLIARAIIRGRAGYLQTGIIRMFAFAIPLALLDELHQAFIPGRFCDGWDALADIIGLALAALILNLAAKPLIEKDRSIYCILIKCDAIEP
jgi:VanZ family protein